MKRLLRLRWFLTIGLLLLFIGNHIPARLPISRNEYTFEIGPWDSSSGSVDIPLGLIYCESVDVLVEFEDAATPDNCSVWALVNYQYPTRGVSEAALRFEGQLETTFSFGWMNAYLIPIFVTGFVIRLFYYGTDTVSVDVIITRMVNLVPVIGLGFLACSIVMILGPVIKRRRVKI